MLPRHPTVSLPCRALVVARSSALTAGPASPDALQDSTRRGEPAGRGWGLSGRPFGDPPPDEGGRWGGAGPHPRRLAAIRRRHVPEPPEAPLTHRQGQVPGLGLGSGAVQLLPADRGLSSGLAADAQGTPDLGPTGSLGTGGVDHASRCGVQGLSGVSQALEVLHGSLRTSAGGLQGADGLSDPPAGVGACLGAHVNGSCHRCGPFREAFGKQGFTPQESPE